MITTANLGFPRMGVVRELKWALERAWRDDSYDELRTTAATLRARHWMLQRDRDIERVPVGDFSLYDHVLDAALAVGAVPERFGARPFDPASSNDEDLRRYFVMARGGELDGVDRAPLELTKWLDTNYHYLVPEFAPDQVFTARPERLLAHLREALALGVGPRPVVLGPVSLLGLAKRTDGGDPIELLDRLLPSYAHLVERLRAAGAAYFQFDEPLLVTDLDHGPPPRIDGPMHACATRPATPRSPWPHTSGPWVTTRSWRRRCRLTSCTSTSSAVGASSRR